jgi:acetyl-CoA carboxylase carboxyl transferase subunit beta
MGLFSRGKPKIKVETTKKDGFSGWIKCSGCLELIHATELQNNLNCCTKCGYHYRISAKQRLALLADEGSFVELFFNFKPVDSLNFTDSEKYSERIKKAQEKAKTDEAVKVGTCKISNMPTALGLLDFNFMGGSMGSVVGERITCLIEYAVCNNLPLVIVSASGGARMQESMLSLMQMAKTAAALTKLHEKGLPYISILTNPTTGGVTASFASLGDIIIAEPEALIAFAGPRVVEQTIGHQLPKGAQKSEFLLEKGMIDCIVKREDLKKQISFFIDFLHGNNCEKADIIVQKIPQRLKDLFKIAEKQISKNEKERYSYNS